MFWVATSMLINVYIVVYASTFMCRALPMSIFFRLPGTFFHIWVSFQWRETLMWQHTMIKYNIIVFLHHVFPSSWQSACVHTWPDLSPIQCLWKELEFQMSARPYQQTPLLEVSKAKWDQIPVARFNIW